MQYGGIPRWVLEWHQTKTTSDPISNDISEADIRQEVNDLSSSQLYHQKVSGKMIHLIPSEDYRSFAYQWARTYIMELYFDKMFAVSKERCNVCSSLDKVYTWVHGMISFLNPDLTA